MIVVGIEPSHSPVFNRRDGRAVSRAKRAIATDEFLGRQRFVGIQHNQYFVTGQTRGGCTHSSRSNRSRRRTGRVPAIRTETLELRLESLLFSPITVDWVFR